MIALKNVGLTEEGRPILKAVTAKIADGQHTWINGPCGSGKTSLAKIMAGKKRVSQGTVEVSTRTGKFPFDGVRIISFSDNTTLFHGANANHYYQQRFNSWDADGHLTVREYIHSLNISTDFKDLEDVLEELHLTDLLDTERIKLSSGQHRKMFLVKALAHRPELLLLDNLYLGLDRGAIRTVNETLDRLVQQRDLHLVIIGHGASLPRCIDHEIELDKGSVAYQGPMRNRCEKKVTAPRLTGSDVVRLKHDSPNWPAGHSVLKMEDVSISYSGKELLSGFNWSITRGEKWVLSGKNGAGKSLVLSLICGDSPQAHANRISLFGRRIGSGLSIWEIKHQLGFTSPELHAYFRSDLRFSQVIRTGYYDKLTLPKDSCKLGELGHSLMDYFKVESMKNRRFSTLSTGEQRIGLFIRSVVKNPPFLLLDEPFQGIDEATIERAKYFLDQGLSNYHTAVLISHQDHHIPSSFSLRKPI